jgi:toxin FitB
MKYLVDANVLSEPTKPDPDVRVVEWLRRHEREVAVDPIIIGEIRFGIHLLPNGARKRKLEKWFDAGISRVQCIPFQAETGMRWARLLAELRAAGRSMPVKDSLIAATALTHAMTVVTRNTDDFAAARVATVNPFAP